MGEYCTWGHWVESGGWGFGWVEWTLKLRTGDAGGSGGLEAMRVLVGKSMPKVRRPHAYHLYLSERKYLVRIA